MTRFQKFNQKKRLQCITEHLCYCCKAPLINKPSGYCDSCLERYRTNYKPRSRSKIRDEVYEKYGGAVCKCCGETRVVFLVLDHIHGGGYRHRQQVGSGVRLYYWLKRNNYPYGFQVLCQNCNVGKWRNKGICPHEVERVQRLSI